MSRIQICSSVDTTVIILEYRMRGVMLFHQIVCEGLNMVVQQLNVILVGYLYRHLDEGPHVRVVQT